MNHEQKWFNNFEAIRFGDAVWETERGAFHCSVRRLHPLAIFVIAFAIDFDFFDQLHDRLPCSSCFRATFLFFESPLTSRVLPRLFFSFLVAHLNSAFANVLAVCVWGGSGVGGREGTRSRFSGPAPSGPSSDGAVFNKSFYSKNRGTRASGAPAHPAATADAGRTGASKIGIKRSENTVQYRIAFASCTQEKLSAPGKRWSAGSEGERAAFCWSLFLPHLLQR